MESKKKCKRHGCLKQYQQTQNQQGKCGYHPGMPIFHDLKKGWTCCNKIVYDWDQFQKLPTCAVGKHTDIKDQKAKQFYQSSTVSNAANALKKQEQQKIVIKDINQYNQELQQKKKQAEQNTQKKLFKTKQGKLKCVNKGCCKDYVQQQNGQQSCHFHKGEPIFHDLKKYWTCCGKQTHDWDEFMKLPTCCNGFHSPKYV